MPRMLKRLPLALAIATLIISAILVASCGSSDSTQARFVNAVPYVTGGGTIDIEVNNSITKIFAGVQYLDVAPSSGYTGITSGSDTIQALLTGTSTQAFSSSVSLSGSTQYTLVATGPSLSGVVILNPVDNNTRPPNGVVEFRVTQASPSTNYGVDVYILANPSTGPAGTPTFSNLAYKTTTSYTPTTGPTAIPYNTAGSGWTLYVCQTGTTTPIITSVIQSFGGTTEGSIRTIVLGDQYLGGSINQSPLLLSDLN